MGHASQSHPWEDELSLKSRLRSMEHEKEHHHAEAAKRIGVSKLSLGGPLPRSGGTTRARAVRGKKYKKCCGGATVI
jgi:uncharacterized protein YchJ